MLPRVQRNDDTYPENTRMTSPLSLQPSPRLLRAISEFDFVLFRPRHVLASGRRFRKKQPPRGIEFLVHHVSIVSNVPVNPAEWAWVCETCLCYLSSVIIFRKLFGDIDLLITVVMCSHIECFLSIQISECIFKTARHVEPTPSNQRIETTTPKFTSFQSSKSLQKLTSILYTSYLEVATFSRGTVHFKSSRKFPRLQK